MSGTGRTVTAVAALLAAGCSFIDDYGDFFIRDGGVEDGGADAGCGVGETSCRSGCVNLDSDRENCGTCENACPAGQWCVSGGCEVDCPVTHTVCDAGGVDECIDTRTAVAHCGGCGQHCSENHAVPSCVAGSCELACEAEYDDCNGDTSDGCEQPLDVAAHCGACDTSCLQGIECVSPRICGDRPVEIAVGERHSCARNAEGDVLCWGDGTLLSVISPLARLRDADPAMAISVGSDESCAVLPSGVHCWSAQTPTRTSAEFDVVDVHSLESGGITRNEAPFPGTVNHHCALLAAEGALVCWGGRNWEGMFGVEDSFVPAPTAPADAMPVSDVGVGSSHICEVTTSGIVRCRGGNTESQLGFVGAGGAVSFEVELPRPATRVAAGPGPVYPMAASFAGHTVALLDDGRIFQWGLGSAIPTEIVGVPSTATVMDVDAGGGFSCGRVVAASGEGEVWCWGENARGQLGDGTSDDSPMPQRALVEEVEDLAVGYGHACVLDASGAVRCWGDDRGDALGARRAFEAVPSISGVADLALGIGPPDANHSCLRYASGAMRCWGDNGRGQLPDVAATALDRPGEPTGDRVSRIAAGDGFTCAAHAGGTVQCWGDNSVLQLGTPATGAVTREAGGELDRVLELAAGSAHVCAMVHDDFAVGVARAAVSCWGSNSHGQLGADEPAPRVAANVPSESGAGPLVAETVSSGDTFSCAIDAAGRVVCWGDQTGWRLGVAPETPPARQWIPRRIAGIADATRLAIGVRHSCALDGMSRVWCWGDNGLRLAGVSEGVGRVSPALAPGGRAPTLVDLPLTPGERPIELALGELVSCVLTDAGRVICWGDNGRQQLGRGPGEHPPEPVEVMSLRAVYLAVGSTQACAVTDTFDVVCWGASRSGELGYGDMTTRNAPGLPLALRAR